MSATYDYDGFGHLVGSEVEQLQGPPTRQYFERDAFGSATLEQTWDPVGEAEVPGSKWDITHTQNKGGRRWLGLEEWDFGSVPEPDGWIRGVTERFYDGRGNQTSAHENQFTWQYSGGVSGYEDADTVTHYRSYAKSYWDAAGHLRVHQINRDSIDWVGTVEYGAPWGAYEEYWYDALGRRILKRSRQETPICTDGARCSARSSASCGTATRCSGRSARRARATPRTRPGARSPARPATSAMSTPAGSTRPSG